MVMASVKDINDIRIANFLKLPPTVAAPKYTTDDMTALYLIKVLNTRFRYKVNLSSDGVYWRFDIKHPDDFNIEVLGGPSVSCSWAIADSTIRMISLLERAGKLPKE